MSDLKVVNAAMAACVLGLVAVLLLTERAVPAELFAVLARHLAS
jgi:hypothetical protein